MLTETATVRLLGRPHLISDCKVDVELPEGLTVGQMLDASGLDPKLAPWCVVAIDGRRLAPVAWDWVKPKRGHLVTVSVVPTGSSDGDSNKVLRTVLTVAVIALAAVATWYIGGWGGALAGAAINVGGGLDLNRALLASPGR